MKALVITAAVVFFYWYGGGPEPLGAIALGVIVLSLIYGWRLAKSRYRKKL